MDGKGYMVYKWVRVLGNNCKSNLVLLDSCFDGIFGYRIKFVKKVLFKGCVLELWLEVEEKILFKWGDR